MFLRIRPVYNREKTATLLTKEDTRLLGRSDENFPEKFKSENFPFFL